jgi:hypothetical protein
MLYNFGGSRMNYKIHRRSKHGFDMEPGQYITMRRNCELYKKMLALSHDAMYNEIEQDVIEEEYDDESTNFDSKFTESRDTY